MDIPNLCLVVIFVFIMSANVFSIGIYEYSNDQRYSSPQLCEKVEDCLGLVGAKCVDGVCTCNQSRVCEKVVGKIATQIGESCINDDNCNIDQAACNNKTCTCKPGYIKSSDERSCLLVSARIGDSCEESVQCYTKIPFSGCQENKCVCQQHTHDFNGLCYRDVELNQSCNIDEECAYVKFAKCINSKCNCMERYVASTTGSRCLPIAEEYRSQCVDNSQCMETLGHGSECLNGYCDCREIYQFRKKINKCVMDIFLGEICENHSDCHDPFRGTSRLECILGECKCKTFFTEVNGYCLSSSENLKPYLLIIIWDILVLFILL